MRRRIFGTAASAVVLGLLIPLAGCGSSGDDAGGSGVLRLVAAEYGDTPATSSKAFWDKVTGDFTAANPDIKVEVRLLPWADIDREVSRMVKAGKAPDMALMGAYSDFAAQGRLYSADELLSVSAEANFLQPLAEAGSVGNTLYGLPFVASSRLLFYNQALLSKAGVDAPKTWSDLKSAAKALKDKGVKIPFALPLGPEEAHAEAMIWELSNGGGYADSSGNYNLASDQNIQTFRWIKDNLVSTGLTGPVPPSQLNRADAFAAFVRGEVGMLNGYPSLAHEARAKGIDVRTVTMPVSDTLGSGETPPTVGVADWMMAFKQNGKREQIGKFLEFIYQDKNLSDFAGRYHLLPSTVSAARTPAGGGLDKNDEYFLTALRGAQLYPVNDPSWVTVSDTIKRNIGRAVEPSGDAKAVLEDIASKANEARKQH
ncbi:MULTISPECIES: extracellular solute-binding protein [unclassified Streptomyces]|uniref:ABC transporter substrate-binding protein n=1 Tax=unclassified Streptomyces TaxID=2593676 RepID=UPI001BE9B053|nr:MULTISPECIES: extracellular solute-binding protein [unclassified Streptomyces]MBT2405700.1 extracellular solute-binding protein [Streptomyces sp. ISL-21]MBT2607010.1 extracellular solute-binding protein [Streptomyces sp. ISL-87]